MRYGCNVPGAQAVTADPRASSEFLCGFSYSRSVDRLQVDGVELADDLDLVKFLQYLLGFIVFMLAGFPDFGPFLDSFIRSRLRVSLP